MNKPKAATASNPTVAAQLAKLINENQDLKMREVALANEVKLLKRQLTESNSVIERDLKADLIRRIKARSDYQDADLEPQTVEQLQQTDATLSRVKGAATSYQSIRTGVASEQKGYTTVGNLFGKTRKEILESGGEF